MPHPEPTILDLTGIAAAVATAPDLDVAFDVLAVTVSAAFRARASIFELAERGATLLAQSRGGLRLPTNALEAVFGTAHSGGRVDVVDLRSVGEGAWTSVPLDVPEHAPVYLLLSGDWTASHIAASLGILLSLSLQTVAARVAERRTRRVSVDGYAMARRMSRLASVDAVCQQIIEQVGRTLDVDRVTLALHRPAENYLAIAAASGELPMARETIRIEPGAWVLGHVYSTGRALVVADVRAVSGAAPDRPHYRTPSFAAVPIFAGAKKLGVLCATDKRDGSFFNRHDAFALRTFAVSASLALVAATTDTELNRLVHASTVDSVSGLFNRPYLDVRLREELERAKRGSSSLTLLMADIDNFKAINDTHGHQSGDEVLQRVGSTFRASVRVFDVCARYGGDEFAILMPSSDQLSALSCAERIRQRVEADDISISIGVAVMEPGDEPADLIRRADRSLYQAKADGKNCVRTNADRQNVLRMAPQGAAVDEPR